MMNTSVAAARIRRELPQVETAINDALQQTAGLMHTLTLARAVPGVPVAVGQAAFVRLAQAQSSLVAAASDVLRVHGELVKVQQDVMGIFDENGECPGSSAELADAEAA